MKALFPLVALVLSSCGLIKKLFREAPKPAPVQEIGRRVIGRIASVSDTGNFVLIQKYGSGKLPKETLFQSNGISGSQASLRPTGERVRDFFAADIVSGSAAKGDAVTSFPIVREKLKISPAEAPKTTEEPPQGTQPE
ncbi:hypothetical protein N9Z85_05460 [Akkermansiaceae bacterium]|jgi:hypothetical protein|nr:hypothetical protein [Akkermansiaceae bacterium]MDB4400948.1 hypothetical protein [Akkermansiaceae bacterium]|tara:strand:- start:4831 stop:5244 length:414 start_codon:yes stop_codon:yes gene_type:complete